MSNHPAQHSAPAGQAPDDHPSTASIWFMALRPRTLPAAIAPVIIGLAIAARHSALNVPIAAVTLLDALLIQIATNLANDYYDFKKGADTSQRVGPTRVTQAGLVEPAAVRRAAFGVLALAALLGTYLIAEGGLLIAVIGIAGLISAIAYTGGPFPLAYIGLGDVFVFLFFGIAAVSGTVWLQLGLIVPEVWPAILATGAPATAILVANNLRDRKGDALANKRTLAVRFGERAARIEYTACIALGFVGVVWMAWSYAPATALALATLPLGITATRNVWQRDGADLNDSLAETAKLELLIALALSIALAL